MRYQARRAVVEIPAVEPSDAMDIAAKRDCRAAIIRIASEDMTFEKDLYLAATGIRERFEVVDGRLLGQVGNGYLASFRVADRSVIYFSCDRLRSGKRGQRPRRLGAAS